MSKGKSKHIGVVGSRRRDTRGDYLKVRKAILKYFEDGDIIVSGGCPTGADHFAEMVAREIGATIIIHHANWKKHGKSAGFIRNSKIAEDSHYLICCRSDDRTGGTEDTLRRYKKLGKLDWVAI